MGQLKEVFDASKKDGILGLWTNGYSVVAVVTDSNDFVKINELIYNVADIFDMDKESMGGGAFPSKFIEKFKTKGFGIYVD